jgi:hypothetical protein
LPDGQDTAIEVHVSDAQSQYFAETKTATIEEAENFGHDEVPQRGTSSGSKAIHCV